MRGTTSDVGGMDSAMTSWNMVMARTAVSANDTFSPDSGGRTNTSIPTQTHNPTTTTNTSEKSIREPPFQKPYQEY